MAAGLISLVARRCVPRRTLVVLLLASLFVLPLRPTIHAQEPDIVAERAAQWLALEPPTPSAEATKMEGVEAPEAIEGLDAWSTIAYQSYRDGNWEIYVARGDNSEPRRLTVNGASDLRPDLNRQATKIVFVSTRDGDPEIFTINVDGSSLTQLTHNDTVDRDPRWSPDGMKIVYSAEGPEDQSLFVMNENGTGRYRLTSSSTPDLMPAWSPDGTRIAWMRVVDSRNGQLMTIRPDGSDIKAHYTPQRFLQNPTWHPSSQVIVYDAAGYSSGYIWNFLQSYNIVTQGPGSFYYTNPLAYHDTIAGAFSPDGEWVIYTHMTYQNQNGQLVLTSRFIERKMVLSSTTQVISGGDSAPRWERSDWAAPQTQMVPLPPFSRYPEFLVSWQATDIGTAGLSRFALQWQLNAGAWSEYEYYSPKQKDYFTGEPGQTLSFRVRGIDNAGNVEPWPPTAETTTRLYTLKLAGRVTDQRGIDLNAAPVTVVPTPLDPPVTRISGEFNTHLTRQNENYTAGVQRQGYGALPSSRVFMDTDQDVTLYLPGAENLLSNGGFEAVPSMQGWQLSGDLPISPETQAHSGTSAAQLGADCPLTCLVTHPFPPNVDQLRGATLDPDGRVYLIWNTGTVPVTLYYAIQQPDRSWGTPQAITTHFTVSDSKVLVGPQGRVHAIYSAQDGNVSTVFYRERYPDGTWSVEAAIPSGILLGDITLDANGTLHYLYAVGDTTSQWKLVHRVKPVGASWGPIEEVARYSPPTGRLASYAFAVDSSRTTYVIWSEEHSSGQYTDYLIFMKSRSPSGIWGQPEEIGRGRPPLSLYIGYDDRLYMTVERRSLFERTEMGEWVPITISGYDIQSVSVEPTGTIHISASSSSTGRVAYLVRYPNQSWKEPFPNTNSYYFVLDRTKGITLFQTWPRQTLHLPRVPTDGNATLSNAVAIPTTMSHPTVALMFRQEGLLPYSTSHLEVAVQDATTTTVLYEGRASDWTLAWGDLTPWRGQTVTLHIRLRQAAGDVVSQLYVDSVTVSDWLTPVVTSVEPAEIMQGWVGQTVTIHGENFFTVPQLWIGGVAIPNVQRVDDQTLRVVLPATLGPGRHDVRVRDSAGRESVGVGLLRLGRTIYVPLVSR